MAHGFGALGLWSLDPIALALGEAELQSRELSSSSHGVLKAEEEKGAQDET